MARSRNRAVIGRKSGSIIDIYMMKGQCIARCWPVDQLFEPSPQYLQTHAAVVREREIEKRLSLDDVLALKFRAINSRYNWWEVLGRIHLSREYHHPGTTTGSFLKSMNIVGNSWLVKFTHDRSCYARILLIRKNHYPRPGHFWYYATHREAGLENTLRGKEAIGPDATINRALWESGPMTTTFMFSKFVWPKDSLFIIQTFDMNTHTTMTGESGLYLLTEEIPWYLNAPISLG